MSRRFAKPTGIAVLKVDKSGGCVDRDQQYLAQARQAQIREYFFGDVRSSLSPHTLHVDFEDVAIWRVVDRKSELSYFYPPSFLFGHGQDPVPDK